MSGLAARAARAFDDYNVSGLPVSGVKNPIKSDIRAVFVEVLALIAAALPGAKLKGFKTSRALLYADLGWVAGDMFVVAGDPTAAYNGLYIKSGVSGSGSWANSGLTFPVAMIDDIATLLATQPEILAAAVATAADRVAAAASALTASGASSSAIAARDEVIAALDLSVATAFFGTRALANAAASGLPADTVLMIFVDEDHGGKRTLSRKEGGVLEYKVTLNPLTAYINGSSLLIGDGALSGNADIDNTGVGQQAGQNTIGWGMTAIGKGAAAEAEGNLLTAVGRTAGERAKGDGLLAFGPISMRAHIGNRAVGVGFAAGQNIDGARGVYVGDHAGAPPHTDNLMANPVANVGANTITTDPPLRWTPEVGKEYRLGVDDGTGTAPSITSGTLVGTSTLVACTANTGSRVTWELLDYTLTGTGVNGYRVGLCYNNYDDAVNLGSGYSDGVGQVVLGGGSIVEVLPMANGEAALGRGPAEVGAGYGYLGVRRWRTVIARYMGLWADAGEPAWIDFGHKQAGVFVLRFKPYLDPTSGDLHFASYDVVGASVATPLILTSDGWVKPRVVNAANDAAAATANVPVGAMYRNGSALMVRVS